MNITYIKRQLVLNDLNISIDKDIKRLYDEFMLCIKYDEIEEDGYNKILYYRSNGYDIFYYTIVKKTYILDNRLRSDIFGIFSNHSPKDTYSMVKCFLEHFFNKEVKEVLLI